MAIEKISENKRKQIINKSVNPLPNNPSKAGYKADEIKKAMFNFVTDEKDSVVDEINRIVDETNASFDDINNTNQETSKTIESINNTIKQINDTVSDKVDKEEGKHLSSNDFSSEEKEKLAKLTNYDDSEVRAGINEINSKIPAQASSTNQLADKDFVNSSIETATATFKGTFEDLDLLKTTPADNNDYAFYDHISNSNRVFDRYKYNGTEWVYEYTLNNSSFTDAQWKAINSGATAELINKILTNADNINTILNTLNNIDTRLNDTVDKSSPQNISGLKNFTKRPTVNNTEVALKTDIAEGVGTTVTVKGEAVTEFNADTKVNVETGKSLSSNDFTDALLNKLNGIAEGANKTTTDTALSDTSTNPVQNKIINNALKGKLSTTGNAVSATKATQDGDGNVITDTYLKLTGGTLTGEITIGQGDGKGIQLGKNGIINATASNGLTNRTVLGFLTEDNLTIGNGSFNTLLRGKQTNPTYNGANLALVTDNVASATKATQDSDGKQINTTYTKIANNIISAYGTCSTAAATAAKVVTVADTNWTLKIGTIIGVKFTNGNTASSVTLNVNSTGAKSIYYNNAVYTGNNQNMTGRANTVIYFMYDGTYWVWFSQSNNNDDDNIPSAICWTAAATAAKTASCTSYALLAKSHIQVIIATANTYAGAITMNINGKGAKPIYINGSASSSSNYTLPAASYIVFYDGTNYHFRTDGNIPPQTDWINLVSKDINSSTLSTSKQTMDLSSYLPSVGNGEIYEVVIGVSLYRTSGTTAVRVATDLIGDINNTSYCFNPIVSGESEYDRNYITVPLNRYIYYFATSTSSADFGLRVYGYRRVK